MIGIYTPTHRPEGLMTPYRSIRYQKFDKWLLVLNGDCSEEDIPLEIRQDERVVVAWHKSTAIGALKKYACDVLISQEVEVLVELDHDDSLTLDAMKLLSDVSADEFVFSDTGVNERYSSEWGWSAESQIIDGERWWVHDTPEVCARSLYEIFYAPNHIRVWGRQAYLDSGGYDELEVCDDHDLLCRTYLANVPMRKVSKPLYLQRSHEGQTQIEKNALIQTKQAEIGSKYLFEMAQEDARRGGLQKIDLGASPGETPGFQSLNVRPHADIQHDATKPLPFETGSVGVFRAQDFLEHIPIGSVVPLMNEIYRCLAPGGWLFSSTPSTDGRGAFQDPTHVSFWNSNSFWYYTRESVARFVPEIECRFQLTKLINHHPSSWHKLHEILYTDCVMWALKGQRQIGVVEI